MMDKQALINILKKIESHLAYLEEMDLILLRGHLLLEEILYNIISEFVFHSNFIKKSDLTFSQKVSIARSISLDEQNNPIWGLILAINKFRNTIAHELPSKENIYKPMQKVKDLYNGEMGELESESKYFWKEDNCKGMRFAISLALGFLNSASEEVKRFKEAVCVIDKVCNPHRHKD
jgi:hypothetical protein